MGDAIVDVGAPVVDVVRGDTDAARDHLSDADESSTGDASNADRRAADSERVDGAEAGSQKRARLDEAQAGMVSGVTDGYDPPSVATFENYDSIEHSELHSKAQGMDGAALRDAAGSWADSGNAVGSTFTTLGEGVAREIAAGWEGPAAYTARSANLGQAFALTGSKMEEAASGADQIRATMPPPVEFNRSRRPVEGGLLEITDETAVGVGVGVGVGGRGPAARQLQPPVDLRRR